MNCGIVVPAMFIRVMAIVFTVVPEKYQLYFWALIGRKSDFILVYVLDVIRLLVINFKIGDKQDG